MTYSQNTWVDHSTPIDASHMNHLETQYATAQSDYQAGSWGTAIGPIGEPQRSDRAGEHASRHVWILPHRARGISASMG